MYATMEAEASRQHREELLRDADRRRLVASLRKARKGRGDFFSVLLQEITRDLGRARQSLHVLRTNR